MTHNQLHEIKSFADLFADRRLVAAVTYLRENHPEKDAGSADHWRGWFDCLAALEKLKEPKQPAQPSIRSAPYSSPTPATSAT